MLRNHVEQTRRLEYDVNDGGVMNYYNQLNERRNWLFSLGLIESLARDLAMQTMRLPEFNMGQFQHRVEQLSMQTGPSRLAAVDGIVLNEIRNMMQHPNDASPAPPITNNSFTWSRGYEQDSMPINSTSYGDLERQHEPHNLPRLQDVSVRQNWERRPMPTNNYRSENYPKRNANLRSNHQVTNNNINRQNQPLSRNRRNRHQRLERERSNYHQSKRDLVRNPAARIVNNIRHKSGRKRAAPQLHERNVESSSKKLKIDHRKPIFNIGTFEMPYIRISTKPLPQPEHKSYAINFFKRQHSCIVGESEEVASVTSQSKLTFPSNFKFQDGMYIRRRILNEFSGMYERKNYHNWRNWWNSFKWVENLMERELEVYKGVNLRRKSFMQPNSKLDLQIIPELFSPTKRTSSTFVMCVIFELMNEKYLESLDSESIGKLEDALRYIPNDLWVQKFKLMVFLWSRYYQIQTLGIEVNSAEVYATHNQWNSPKFHWLAKQAFDELVKISEAEWPDHKQTFNPTEIELETEIQT